MSYNAIKKTFYLGDGRMVEAANPTSDTRISELSVEKLVGIRRLAG